MKTATQRRESNRAYYLKNRERLLKRKRSLNRGYYLRNRNRLLARALERHRAWRAANPIKPRVRKPRDLDKTSAKRRRSYLRHRAAVIARSRDNYRRGCDTLSDAYVRALLARNVGVGGAAIPQALVDAKRAHLELIRSLKERA